MWKQRSPGDWWLRDGAVLVADVVRSLRPRKWLWRVFNGLSVTGSGRATSRVAAIADAEAAISKWDSKHA
jgi:hypothetical protein